MRALTLRIAFDITVPCDLAPSSHPFYCPSAYIENDGSAVYKCQPAAALCDNKPDCPAAEDEDLQMCIFYRAVSF